MDPTTTAKETCVKNLEFVNMDEPKETASTLSAKEKKAAYMREYHQRKRAAKKAKVDAKTNSTSKQVKAAAHKQEVERLRSLNSYSGKAEEIAKSRVATRYNVVDFAQAVRIKDPETIKLWMLSQAVDGLVVSAVGDGLKPTDIAGVVANRLKAICEAAGPEVLSKIKEKIL